MESVIFRSTAIEKYLFTLGNPTTRIYYNPLCERNNETQTELEEQEDVHWLNLSEQSLADWDNEDDDFFNTLISTR